MNRIDFIKNLVGNGILLTLPVPKLPGAIHEDLHEEVFIYGSFIAGFQFYEGEKCIKKMKAGDPLDLVREPDNAHDELAIAVYWEGEKLGYLPRVDNLVLANIIEAGLPITCEVMNTHAESSPWEQCEIGVFLVYPEGFLKEPAEMF